MRWAIRLSLIIALGCGGGSSTTERAESRPAAGDEALAAEPAAELEPESASSKPQGREAPAVAAARPTVVRELSAALPVRYEARFRLRNERVRVRRPIVDLGDEARTADLDLRVRSAIGRAALASHPNVVGECEATLATAELVSMMCEWNTRSPARKRSWALTFVLTPLGPQRVDLDEAFVIGTKLSKALCAASLRRAPTIDDNCYTMSVALGTDGLKGSWQRRDGARLRGVTLPYAELASLVRPDRFLAFAAGEAPAEPTPALAAAAPEPRTCWTYGNAAAPSAIGAAVIRSGIDHIFLTAIDAGAGRVWLCTPNQRDIRQEQRTILESALGPRADTPCPRRDAILWRHEATAEIPLHDAPNGSPTGALASGTKLVVFDGVVDGRDSMVDRSMDGLWSFVVAEGSTGWARLSGLSRSRP
ncbi:MAG: hypothetical protein JJ863_24290 [Deltaproteobacteria bacterium]|nr:hypothetical protein [Deltaproteobacteria bacterium]